MNSRALLHAPPTCPTSQQFVLFFPRMKFIIFLLCCLAFLIYIRAEDTGSSDVLVFDDKNFAEEVSKYDYVLVEFYAPWCGHCKSLAPEYEKAATELKGIAHLAKIDADSNRKTAQAYQIQGFPTLKLFKEGKFFKEFDGGRKADDIVAWMKKKTGPVAKHLHNQQEIDAFVTESQEKALIGYYNSESDAKKFFDGYTSEKLFEDFAAGFVTDPELVEKHEAGTIVLHRPFGEPVNYKDTNPSTADLEGFKDFVLSHGYPLVEEISSSNFQRFVDAGVPLVVLFFDPAKKDESLLKAYEDAAGEFKGRLSFATSDGVEYKEQLDSMGGNSAKLPELTAMVIEKRINYAFPSDEELTKETISAWCTNLLSGNVKPHYRSEEIPEKNDGPVYVVVGKTFESVVLDENKDVLLEFYAPWCGHCKSLEPKYNRLGEFLKPHEKSLMIAKIDATANDTPITIEGFPTLFFFPKGSKSKPIPFDGPRTEKGILEFLQKHAVASKDDIANLTFTSAADITAEKKDEL